MFKKAFVSLLMLLSLAVAAISVAQETEELRFLCFQDGNECEVYADLLSRFSDENTDISVAIDMAAEEGMVHLLTDAIEAYDFARVSDIGALAGHLLDLRPQLGGMLEATFRAVYFEALRAQSDDDALHGFPDALDMVAPFVNTSLFEQAGVTLPDEVANWEEWLAVLYEVVEATDASYALSVDNKDHRLVGPAMSRGAKYFDEAGKLTLPDTDGLRDFIQILHQLMQAGKTPADTLLGTGKSQEYFVRGETVMYICGSWKAEEVAAQVGDDFDWTIKPNPTGPGGGTGVGQVTWLVALDHTEQPEAIAKVFEYLLQAEVSAEFSARALTVPAREDLAAAGIDYQTENQVVSMALNAFARDVPNLQDQAIRLDLHPLASEYYAASNTYLRQFFAGDMSLDVALTGLQSQLVAAAEKGSGK